jgi:hypothetical protein
VIGFRIIVGIGAAAALAGAAVAQTGAKPPASASSAANGAVPRTTFIETMDAEFKRMDTDRNGILTKKEIEEFQHALSVFSNQQRLVALFQQLDADKNGQLSPAEFAGLRLPTPPANAAPVLAQTDLNHDGQVTAVEYRAGKLVNFDRMDADKDGIVSIAEMKAAGIIK